MALQVKQTAQQRLMLAPNVTLALEILRMPTLELQTFLQHQLEENPLLEFDEPRDEEEAAAPPEPSSHDEPSPPSLDEDWSSHWRTVGEREYPDDGEEGENRLMEQRLVVPQSLHESLRMQLGCQSFSDEERRLGEVLIQHLDDYGYLESSLEELAAAAGAEAGRLEAVLRTIQRFDPPGIGGRDLRECLMIQLEHRGEVESLAYRILKEHFELFLQHRFRAIAKAAGASLVEVTEACASLRQLDPKPGRAYSGDLPPSIVPDLVIRYQENRYDVELNDQDVPHVVINRTYYRMLRDPATPSDAREFLQSKFRKASWLIKAIDERHTTLLSIARCLISLQHDFLEHGPRAIKPLTQAQVADLIGRHPSTVSRAITGKTIDTPYGIFRVEQLFASGVPQTTDTDTVSDEQIKSELQHLIGEEDPQHPLSDAALAKRLAQRQITVARRTIAKYRTSLKILPGQLRKRRF